MKKTLLTGALIAATLAPAAVQAQDHRWHDRDSREWRQDRRDWRHDRREDWQRWRDSHRDVYRRGTWRAPFAYRSFGIGAVVPRIYWGPQYYVQDWRTYRLPAPGYRWYRYVRHYDDLLLINTRNGRVVRVYRNFYW
jgi:Ni/Co efflux regulator RcnB